MSGDDGCRDAARQLLVTPLVLAATDPEGHRRIRRHEEELAQTFRNYLGYRLTVDARFARLVKAGLGPGEGRPLLRAGSKAPFSPRDYSYLALLCSVLLTTRRQVLLSAVVADVHQAAAEAGIDLGDDTLTERRALVHALRQLVSWGAIVEDAGSVSAYADDPSQEALLWVEQEIIRALVAVPLREVDDPAELIRLAADPGPDGTRHKVRRKIVEGPVVMVDDLPDPERAWLRQYQRREAHTLDDLFRLRLEIRSEGVAAFDPRDEMSDVFFPRDGTLAQAALLTVSALVERVGGEGPAVRVPAGLLSSIVQGLLAEHGRRWSKEYQGHPERLDPDVEDLLVDVGLLARSPDGTLRLRAVAARYAPSTEIQHKPAAPTLEVT
jgi:uncharacterized protein (TIGR02678 family)